MSSDARRKLSKVAILSSILTLSLTPISSLAQEMKIAPIKSRVNITEAGVTAACADLDQLAQKRIENNDVAGMAIAVVYKDKVVFAKGYGVREVGKSEKIDQDTVFQLASVSKPLGATVVAELVGEGKIEWDSKILDLDPDFAMYEPWVTSQLTIRDLYGHRSGLPDHAGDLLEDLGGDRKLVLHQLRYQRPDSSFRSHYAYTNFGLTEGGVAAAKAYGLNWADASQLKLYGPLGMTSTSSNFNDYMSRSNKAVGHVLENGKWVHKYTRQPDAQSPAGGASSSVSDMAKWMRLQITSGKFEGKQIVDAKALEETHHPLTLTGFSPIDKLPGFYGMGFNVGYDEHGRLKLSHSGAFALGAGTAFTIVPEAELGIITLTNSAPTGVAEGLNMIFTDTVLNGKAEQDWLSIFKTVFANPAALGEPKLFDYKKAPASPGPALPNSSYVGAYKNNFFGEMQVIEKNSGLAIVLGPKKLEFPLKHYNRDVFTYETIGENAAGPSGVTFTMGPNGKAQTVLIEHLNEGGEGTFKRLLPNL